MCVCTCTLIISCLPFPSPFASNICILNTHNHFKYSFGVIKSQINQHVPLENKIGHLISEGKLFPTKTILKELNVNC